MSAPRIVVTRWEDIPGERLQFYLDRLDEAGADATAVSTVEDRFDALVLTGGVDIDPGLYGQAPHEKVRRTDPERDEFELAMLRAALATDRPVLAICRGHQLLNVAFGGSLLQHIEGDGHRANRDADMSSRWHSVRVEPDSRLHRIYGRSNLEVNSRHHQAVTEGNLASGLRPVAFAPEGIVEAAESETHSWVVGVQWHPERPELEYPEFLPSSKGLFGALVAAVLAVGGRV